MVQYLLRAHASVMHNNDCTRPIHYICTSTIPPGSASELHGHSLVYRSLRCLFSISKLVNRVQCVHVLSAAHAHDPYPLSVRNTLVRK